MAVKKYGLTKSESDKLNDLLSLARIQQGLLSAVTEQYKVFVLTIFKRVNADPKLFENSKVDLGTGELIVAEPDKPKKEEKKGAN